MPASTYLSVDESFARLHRAGWSIGETGGATVWVVIGTNGENMIFAEGKTQAEACYRATLQAEVVGMLAKRRDEPGCARHCADCHHAGSRKYPRGKSE
jgi:hypothetical protein